jgi:hypothetical protein
MAINSNQKGKRGEREVAGLLRQHGFTARRGQQFSGGSDSPDVVHNIEGVHLEVKRVNKLNLNNAMNQARSDAGSDHPVVVHKADNKPWLATMDFDYFLSMQEIVANMLKYGNLAHTSDWERG